MRSNVSSNFFQLAIQTTGFSSSFVVVLFYFEDLQNSPFKTKDLAVKRGQIFDSKESLLTGGTRFTCQELFSVSLPELEPRIAGKFFVVEMIDHWKLRGLKRTRVG